ncbi:MAG TPA: hypothetical protein VFI84_01045 [Candidatus Saccharimonadales bacterium]|nr:hypothetical protein [Candidatus Saccharimonadales bacterium]
MLKHSGIDTNPCGIETLRSRLHAEQSKYVGGPRIADIAVAEAMAYAEKPHVDRALGYIATAQQIAADLARPDFTPYAQQRRYILQARIDNAGREALNAVILAELAASQAQLTARASGDST